MVAVSSAMGTAFHKVGKGSVGLNSLPSSGPGSERPRIMLGNQLSVVPIMVAKGLPREIGTLGVLVEVSGLG